MQLKNISKYYKDELGLSRNTGARILIEKQKSTDEKITHAFN